MRVEIRTSGGFTGRGIGSVVIDDAKSLRALIDAALLISPHKRTDVLMHSPDEVVYSMTVSHGDDTRTFTWTDDEPPPPAVLALFNAAWAKKR